MWPRPSVSLGRVILVTHLKLVPMSALDRSGHWPGRLKSALIDWDAEVIYRGARLQHKERGLRWSLLPPCPPCLIPPASSVSVVLLVCPELPADLAAGSQRRMDVGIHGAVADGAHDLCELPWCDALGRRPDDISRGDGPGHGAAPGGARRLVAAAAEKGADTAAGPPRAEVDVRRDGGSFQPLVAQPVVDGLGIVVDLRREPARPGCGERRRRLLEAAQGGLDPVTLVVGRDAPRINQGRNGQAS